MNYLVFDVETTGLNPDLAAVVEIAMIPVVNGIKGEPFVSYLKPHEGAQISDDALKINKLTRAQLETFPEAKEVLKKLMEWLDGQQTIFALMGHNVQFDRKFLYSLFCRNAMHTDFITRFRPNDFCTLDMAKRAFSGKRTKPENNKLGTLCKWFEIKLDNAHSALPDIEATYELFQALKVMLPEAPTPVKMDYAQRRKRYLDSSFCQFNPEGDIFITRKATQDPEAMKFIAEEMYHLYGTI